MKAEDGTNRLVARATQCRRGIVIDVAVVVKHLFTKSMDFTELL